MRNPFGDPLTPIRILKKLVKRLRTVDY
jgi:hypothetical protein